MNHQPTARVYNFPTSRPAIQPIKLSKAIENFMLACKARQLSPHTIADYGLSLRRFLAHVGDMYLHEISTVQVTAFLASFQLGAKTIFNIHVGLAALWTWAIREGHTDIHIIRMTEKPKVPQIVISPLDEAEVKKLLASCAGNTAVKNRAILVLLTDTGMRASELCGMRLEDTDLINRRIKVMGKGNKERLIPFSQRTAKALFEYLSQRKPTDKKIFDLQRTSLAQLLRRLGKKAGVRDVYPHRFRHTFAIQYLRNGGDVYTLQSILGHSTLEMVRHYLAIAQIDLETSHQKYSPAENWQL